MAGVPQQAAGAIGRAWRPGPALALLMSYFVLFGLIIGAQGVLWAELLLTLRLSEGVFGTAQLASPLVAVGLLLMGGQLSARFGKKPLALVGLALIGASVLALGRAGGLWGLVAALALGGLGNALLETAMNSATLDWELATGRSVMNLMHAGFSAGAVAGALGAGLLLGLGWAYSGVLAALAVLAGLVLALTVPLRYPPSEPAPADAHGPTATLRVLFGQRVLLLLALVCLLGIVSESVSNTWAVIYLRQLGAEAVVGGAAFALFNIAMLAGRLANALVVARLGARASLLISGAGMVVSAVMLALPGGVGLAVAAFVVMGLTTAGVVPTVLSAAARAAPGNSGAVTGAVMAVAYSSFVICPPLVGWLAELFSLKLALLSVGVGGAGLLALVRSIEDSQISPPESRRP